MPTYTREPSSFRDPSGFLFRRDGVLYRQVNRQYRENFELLTGSGLLEELTTGGLMVPHEEVAIDPPAGESRLTVIRPQAVPFVSYPYEWSFSQLKDAALTTLEIQRRALERGMSLKDASAYNIQFFRGRPTLIDTLSFERYRDGEPWVAYRQFCQHFLAPLALMAYRDVRLSQLFRLHIDGPPLDLASSLLPSRTKLRFSLLSHLHLHAAAQRRYADAGRAGARATPRVSLFALRGLIESLRAAVARLKWSPGGSEWVDYYEEGHRYSDGALGHKMDVVREFIARVEPASVWDLGANTGRFSRLASDRGIPTVAFDIDAGAVERNYLECRRKGEANLLPLVQDLTNPSPSLGWNNEERMSLGARGPAGMVLALALAHHLAISNNVPLPLVARFFRGLSRHLVIEFVPKSDDQVQRLLASRQDIFPDYTKAGFEEAIRGQFRIIASIPIRDSERTLYLLEGED
ncbi:MAG: SAM-dependent methyltransferase [Thermoanaerobaculia bacterium]